ncbi:MAG: cell division protein FtsQ/DivIB, partial [Hyphomicrobiaceae bacterium]
MQSLGTFRLPRLISGSGRDTFGGLRPGDERPGYEHHAHNPAPSMSETRAFQSHNISGGRRSRGLGRILAVAGLGAALFVAFNLPPIIQKQIRQHADNLAINAGLGVDHVAIIGHNRTRMKDIAAALDLNDDKSLIGFSAVDVRQRLKRLPWIESTRVTHILPTTVSIEITERRPFATWQHNGNITLIDRTGHVLGDVSEVPDQSFPLVIGFGAEKNASAFLDKLAEHPRIAKQVIAAVRVADRRWNLKLRTGTKILLPEQGLGTAFASLEQLLAKNAIR